MTEAEWLASSDPESMLSTHLRGVASDRKLRLFAVACCRRIWHLFHDRRSQSAIEVAEKYADEAASVDDLLHAYGNGWAAHSAAFEAKGKERSCLEWVAQFAADRISFFAARRASRFARIAAGDHSDHGPEHVAQANLLREIFANEYRPAPVEPAWMVWNDGTISNLAQSIYADRAYNRLPILADALEDAGCDNADILAHCRQSGEHVRGCWVVDLLLGKE